MPDTPVRPRRAMVVLARRRRFAGMLAGAVAVYVMGSGRAQRRRGGQRRVRRGGRRRGTRAPLAKGEVAAFRVATEPQSLADLAFTDPEGKPVTLAGLAGKAVAGQYLGDLVRALPRRDADARPAARRRWAATDFAVVAVNIDLNATERAKAFLDEIGVANLPFYSDSSAELVPGFEAPRPRHRPAHHDPRRRQGLPHRGAGGTRGVGLRRRQGADQGRGGGVGEVGLQRLRPYRNRSGLTASCHKRSPIIARHRAPARHYISHPSRRRW